MEGNVSGWTRRNERGANLAEFAIIAPLLLLLFAGIADLGRAFYSYIAITNAAGEGARYGARRPNDTSGIEARVLAELDQSPARPCTIDPPVISDVSGSAGAAPSRLIRVQVSCEFDLLTPFIQDIVGGENLTISNFAITRVQGVMTP